MRNKVRITSVDIMTVAIPLTGRLRHSDGVEPLYQIRYLIEMHTDAGITGVGEVGPRVGEDQLRAAAAKVLGESPFGLERLRLVLQSEKFYRMELAMVAAAFQMAALDIQGKFMNLAVSELLGGQLRDKVDMICYLFREAGDDSHAAVNTTDEVVEHAKRLVERHGFHTIKFKAGAAPPEHDIEVMEALRAEFPKNPLRVDPNGAWSVETAINVGRQLEPLNIEWMEDPTLGIRGMAEFNRRVPVPTATNMCCIQPRDIPPVVSLGAVNVVLLDLWYLGGPWSAKLMAALCAPFGLGIGVHSGGGSCEMGVGLAAELQVAAALPGLVHAVDAEYHHLTDDVIVGGLLPYVDGAITMPNGPGLGVELDKEKCAHYHDVYQQVVQQGGDKNAVYFYPKW